MERHWSLLLLLTLTVWVLTVSGQNAEDVTVNITSPLQGNMGGSVRINCTAFRTDDQGMRIFASPSDIVLRRDGVLFEDSRLSSTSNAPLKTYTLENLMRTDNGALFQCSVAEFNSIQVPLEVGFSPVITEFSGPEVADGVATVVSGGNSTDITFTIEANPASTNTLAPSPGNTLTVPPSITVDGNVVTIRNATRNDAGRYLFVSTNTAGSSNISFEVAVEYGPIFTAIISEQFQCDFSTNPLKCVAGVGETGSFYCNFQSNPLGSLTTVIDVPDNSSISVQDTHIFISGTSTANSGNYTCIATNIIRGESFSATRNITFEIGSLPRVVTPNMARVVDNSIVISWSHSTQQGNFPLLGFTVVGGLLNAPGQPTINEMVGAGVFKLVLDVNTLEVARNYVVTIRAVNLLGGSEGRDVTFRTPEEDGGDTTTAVVGETTASSPTSTKSSNGYRLSPLVSTILLSALFSCH